MLARKHLGKFVLDTRSPADGELARGGAVVRGGRTLRPQSSVAPSPVVPTAVRIGGSQSPGAERSNIWRMSLQVSDVPGRSALFTTKMSAISMRPALLA